MHSLHFFAELILLLLQTSVEQIENDFAQFVVVTQFLQSIYLLHKLVDLIMTRLPHDEVDEDLTLDEIKALGFLQFFVLNLQEI